MTDEQAFGIVLRKYRKQLGFSQEELSFRCGFDRSFISLLERGKQSPNMKVVKILAENLNVKASTIILDVEIMMENNIDQKNDKLE